MLASLVAALVSAFCYGIAAVMQAIAVRSASNRPELVDAGAPGGAAAAVDPGLIVRMLRQWRFIASIFIDLTGFVAQLVALRRLPLFAVQAIIAVEPGRHRRVRGLADEHPPHLAGVARCGRGGDRGRAAGRLGGPAGRRPGRTRSSSWR